MALSPEERAERNRAAQRRFRERHPGHAQALRRKSYNADPEAAAKQRAAHRADPRKHLLASAKKRARQKGIEFSITKTDIPPIHSCAYTGATLVVGDGKLHDLSPTLDRINPNLGYIPGNIAVVSYRANRIKNDATPQELRALADAIERYSSQ